MPQTVLVTGGAHGIGRGIVQSFLTTGAMVAVMDLEPPASPSHVLFIQGDVSQPLNAEAAITRCYTRNGTNWTCW